VSGTAEGMAWEAVHRDGDAVLPDQWLQLSAQEREAFRNELEEWMSKPEAQLQLFADQGRSGLSAARVDTAATLTDLAGSACWPASPGTRR
jgi:hypothetical protein